MDNFQDRYIRTNPRRNAKMNPILWDDNVSRYFTYHGESDNIECFQNLNSNGNKKTTQIKCKNGKADILINDNCKTTSKMYDIDLDSISKMKFKDTINEIDNIHNKKIVNSMSFDRMMLDHFNKTIKKLHLGVNSSVLSLHSRDLKNDDFFNPPKNNNKTLYHKFYPDNFSHICKKKIYKK
tara:strand:+ start:1166 stop:1708 length:543 start_codon:yes stop_codon:yes gene_type:complete